MNLFDNPLKDRHVGLNPRRNPMTAFSAGFWRGTKVFLFSFALFFSLWVLQVCGDLLPTSVSPVQLVRRIRLADPVNAMMLRASLAIALGGVAGWRMGRRIWRETPLTEPFLQLNDADPKIYYGEQAEHILKQAFADESSPTAEPGIAIAPHVVIPRMLERRNIMILGASGSGKSNICRSYAQQAIERGDFVVLHCTKGDVTRAFRMQQVVLVSPTHEDGWAYDIGTDVDGPPAAAEFSSSVIPRSDQPFWSDTARLVLTDLILSIIAERQCNWGARELLEAVLMAPAELRKRIETFDLSASPLLAGSDEDGVSKTVESILITMVSGALTTLRPMAYAWSRHPASRRFSVKRAMAADWIGPRVLIVQSHPESPTRKELSGFSRL